MATRKLLAVCLGNICRSPTAEAALREAAAAADLEVEVRSAGTGDWHVGHPPDSRMQDAASAAGLPLSGVAAQVSVEALEWADLVLAMDRQNLSNLEALAASASVTTPIRLFRDFDPRAKPRAEVPDPYHGGPEGFVEVVEMARRTAAALIRQLASDRY